VSGEPRRHGPRPASGRHLLRHRQLASELVTAADISACDLVVEIGAGGGRLTEPLAAAAGAVIAIERDASSAAQLRRRFDGRPWVRVIEGDALGVPLPREPYRVVANLPFGITTAMLRRLLDDPAGVLIAADLIVQRGFAVKRCAPRPCTLLSAGWLPWWRLTIDRILPSASFDPPPAVDAAVLSIRRRTTPLIDAADLPSYRALLRQAFRRDNRPVRMALGIERRRFAEFARPRGITPDVRPPQLDVWDWVALHRHVVVNRRS
jgi:23S rRNA (adenine-N6)-dimethyltransferase